MDDHPFKKGDGREHPHKRGGPVPKKSRYEVEQEGTMSKYEVLAEPGDAACTVCGAVGVALTAGGNRGHVCVDSMCFIRLHEKMFGHTPGVIDDEGKPAELDGRVAGIRARCEHPNDKEFDVASGVWCGVCGGIQGRVDSAWLYPDVNPEGLVPPDEEDE